MWPCQTFYLLSLCACVVYDVTATKLTNNENNETRSTTETGSPAARLQTGSKTVITGNDLSSDQSNLLHHAVKSMLGFPEVAEQVSVEELTSVSGTTSGSMAAPRYMMKLYEDYQSGGGGELRKNRGNTVRSINSKIGAVNGIEMFIFNLSSIRSEEAVIGAELHLYQKHVKSRPNRQNANLILHQVGSSYMWDLEERTVAAQSYGWQSIQMTDAVRRCLEGGGHDLLTISFERDSGRYLDIKRFMRHSYRPFLIVFSNDTQNITQDHIDPHFKQGSFKENIIDPETGRSILNTGFAKPQIVKQRKNKIQDKARSENYSDEKLSMENYSDEKLSVENYSDEKLSMENYSDEKRSTENYSQSKDYDRLHEVPVVYERSGAQFNSSVRRRRSLDNNEIPQDEVHVSITKEILYNVPITNTQTQNSKDYSNANTQISRLLPYPGSSSRMRRRRRKHRKARHQSKLLPLPEEWEAEFTRMQADRENEEHGDGCSKHELLVDFADIGWNDWIISPSSFQANYCKGSCPFPLTKNSQPTNHATIQSLVHAVGLTAGVPAPCCVPLKMSALTLLYFDQNRNVVLKNYPNMSVDSCACR